MAKPLASSNHVDVETQHSAAQHGGGLPATDDGGNVDDPPPIPNGVASAASSTDSVLLNDKSKGGARTRNTTTTNSSFITIEETNSDNIHAHAHTLSASSVANILATDAQYVEHAFEYFGCY